MISRVQKSAPGIHGQVKKQAQFMMTPAASDMLDEIADAAGITRSECVERIIRTAYQADWEIIKDYKASSSN